MSPEEKAKTGVDAPKETPDTENAPKKPSRARETLTLFLSMLKIGLFTFGGGYAMLSLLENEFVTRKQWMTREEFLDMTAVAESTPGPIAINSATYIGYRRAGVTGSAFATLGVCIPSFVIIFVISLFFDAFLALEWVGYAFRGVQVAVIYLIFTAGLKLMRGIKKNVFNIVITATVLGVFVLFSLFAVRFSTVFYILICGAAGVTVYLIGKLRKGGEP